MPTVSTLQDLYRDLGSGLALVEEEIGCSLRAEHPAIAELCAHAGRFGGKRLRPALVLLIGGISGGVGPRHVQLGTVVELIHLATLVHDDVIDEASMRRAQPTVHSRWSNYEAVLLGDIIFARAINLLARLGDQEALLRLTRAVSVLCEGEILQNRRRRDAALTEEDYYAIVGAKTAELYSVGAGLAAHLAGAPPEAVEAFLTFGYELGVGFQIVDDALDLTGAEAEVGKSLGTDLRSGKMTLPLVLLRERADARVRALLREVITSDSADPGSTAALLAEIRGAGVIDSSLARAAEHAQRGLSAVHPHVDEEGRHKLRIVADFVVQRRL